MSQSLNSSEQAVIERYFAAMRSGAAGGEEMMSLFADDAVLIEPFSGMSNVRTGKAAIRDSLVASQRFAPADMALTLDRLEVSGGQIRSTWTCDAPAFPHPMRGEDLWTIRDGKIVRLETRLLDS